MFRALNLVASVALLGVACNAGAASLSLVPTTSVTGVEPGDFVTFDIRTDFTGDPTLGGGFDIFFDPGALQFVSFTSSGVSGPDFHRDPDILAGVLKEWCDGGFFDFPEIATLGDVTFEVLPTMGAATDIAATDGSGICGPWVSALTFQAQFVMYNGFLVEALDTDGDGNPNHSDPDDDNDGIGDALDNQPLVADNNCTTNNGTNATLVGATISAQQTTCASKESVDVSGTTNVGIDGDLLLISEKVSLTDTSVTDNGLMEVINADPCPGCSVCGNGVVEAWEQCDDGNTVGGDGCSATCQND